MSEIDSTIIIIVLITMTFYTIIGASLEHFKV